MQNQTHLLKSKKFLPLFITQFFGAFNDNVFKNAFLIWFTYDIAQKLEMDAQVMVTIAAGLFILPFFLFSALAGQIADKYEKSKLTQIIKIAEIIIMSFAFIGFYFENINLLLLLLFLMGTHSTFFGPIKYSLLPEHLQKEELVGGNGLIEGGTFLAILFGTIFGGSLIRTKYGIEIVSLSVIIFAMIGYFASRVIPKTIINDAKSKISFNIFLQTFHIINFAKKEKTVWCAIIAISWFWLIGATFLSQFPIYTKNIINGDEMIVTLFLAIFSIGIAIGSTLCNKLLKGKISVKLVPYGSIGMSIGIIIFCLASYFYNLQTKTDNLISLSEFLFSLHSQFIILGLLLVAISAGIYIVPLYTLMQYNADQKYISRIIAANNILNALFICVSSILIIILYKLKFDLFQIFSLLAFANFLILFWIKKIKV